MSSFNSIRSELSTPPRRGGAARPEGVREQGITRQATDRASAAEVAPPGDGFCPIAMKGIMGSRRLWINRSRLKGALENGAYLDRFF